MLKYIILGLVQGITEFLPVSSSGHLIIMQRLLGVSGNEVALSIVLHLATSLALVIFFFKDILKLLKDIKLLSLIIIVTIITGIIAVLGKDFFRGLFSSPRLVAIALVFTGIILILSQKFMEAKRSNLNFKDALFLGLTQAVAIIPGVSRSGITISTLLFRRIERQTAFRFSFLASIPAVLGAVILEARKISFCLETEFKYLFMGFIFSLLSGLIALWILKIVLNRAKFHYFGYYCIIMGIIILR